ncbi:MAG: LysR family transcriptional regulator [Sandaracinus sp.]|nr:LysR family transcriptional regulator [Sandaracinus sp.]MCB9630709.1 LysR family transcriptional regulator [Sandaracinus sp.]
MSRTNGSLDDVVAFVEVVAQGGFGAAAQRLGLSTSVVSKRVSALEERLAVQLLVRTTRKVVLTDAGRHFYEEVRHLPRIVADAEARLQSVVDEPRGRLRVMMPTYFGGAGIQHDVIPSFMEAHRDVTLELVITTDPTQHLSEDFDVFVAGKLPHDRFPDTSMRVRHLFRFPGELYAAPSYLEEHGTPKHPRDLIDHDCLSYPSRDWSFVDPETREPFVVSTKGSLTTNSNAVLWAATIRGLGIAYSFPYFFGHERNVGKVVRVLEEWTRESYVDIHVLQPPTRFVPPATRAFIDALVAHFEPR